MSTFSQYSNLTYIVELIALGLVAAALIAVTASIFFRRWAGTREHKKMLSIRRLVEKDKDTIDSKVTEIHALEQRIQEDASTARASMTELEQKQSYVLEKTHEIEQRSEHIIALEQEMKQAVDGITKRLDHIQSYWDQQLKDTVSTIDQINNKLDDGLKRTTEQEKLASEMLASLTRKYETMNSHSPTDEYHEKIKSSLEATLVQANELLHHLKKYQLKADDAFHGFANELNRYESQAMEEFDAIFNAADVARQEMNASLDESREYAEHFRGNKTNTNIPIQGIDDLKNVSPEAILKDNAPMEQAELVKKKPAEKIEHTVKGRQGRPIINMESAENLTDSSLIKNYQSSDHLPVEQHEKNLVSLFTKIRKHGS